MKKMTMLLGLGLTMGFLLTSCLNNNIDPATAQLQKEITAIDNYLANDKDSYIIYDGLNDRIAITAFGHGTPVHAGQNIIMHYEARLFADTSVLFDSGSKNVKWDDIARAGLKSGVSALFPGAHAKIYVPSINAFGAAGDGGLVPGNSTVVYDIVVDSVVRTATERQQFSIDSAMIASYIDTVAIPPTYDPAGFWYVINAPGTGENPTPYQTVNMTITTKLISNGMSVSSNLLVINNAFSWPDAIKIGLPKLKEGGKATFYVPSLLGYGATKYESIPANAPLIFEVKLATIQ